MATQTTRKLFGTDGVRGAAGTFLSAELATSLGRAVTATLEAERPQVLIVRDTRESGPMLEAALAAGVAAAGGDALLGGVLPTPAAAILVKRLGLDLAAVVSASHNPFQDNGIKFFDGGATKLGDEREAQIEALMEEPPPASARAGAVRELNGGLEDYLRELERAFPLDLSGRHVVLDCANGATFRAGPAIFERLGARVETIGVEPDGRNINADCGSTHMEALVDRVRAAGADLGFAFDGDELIALGARGMAARGELDGVVVTVMTNYGFHRAMAAEGIEVAITQVGDRYVIDEMLRRGWQLGGEQSGHIIATDFVATGDGIAAALMTMRELGDRALGDAAPMEKLPQVLVNVEVADREAVRGATVVWDAVERENGALEGRGRVLLRPSGTEPLVRVMAEAPSAEEAEAVCARLVAIVRDELA